MASNIENSSGITQSILFSLRIHLKMSPVSKDESVTRSRRSTSGTRSSRSIRKSLQFLNPTTWRKSIPPAKDLQFPDTPSQEQYEEIKKVMKSTICGTPPTSRKEKRYGRLFLEAPDVLVDLKFQHTQPSNGSIPGIPERISSLGPMVIDSRDTHQDDADSCETRVRLSRRSTAKFIPDSPIKPAQGLKRKRTMEFYIGKVVKTEK